MHHLFHTNKRFEFMRVLFSQNNPLDKKKRGPVDSYPCPDQSREIEQMQMLLVLEPGNH